MNPTLDIRCTLELLVDLIFETDDEREQFGVQVEKLISEKLAYAARPSPTHVTHALPTRAQSAAAADDRRGHARGVRGLRRMYRVRHRLQRAV